jgi:hypothetical protein
VSERRKPKARSLALAAVLTAATASAEETAAPVTNECADKPEVCGRRAFALGVTAYEASDWATATARFGEALQYKWHPAIALNLALAESRAGHPAKGIQDLDAVLASPDATPALIKQATTERERLQGLLSTIEIDAAASSASILRVDGNVVDSQKPLEVEPGAHRLEVTLPSGAVIRRSVTLEPRERLHLSIDRTQEFVVLPERERSAGGPSPASSPEPPPGSARGVPPLWFYVSAGATAVLGGVTVWSALDTRAAYRDYERALPTASQADVDRRVNAGHSLETRTNVLLAVTGVAALGSAALGIFFVKWSPSPTSTTALIAGPGNLAFRMSF